MNINYDYYKVFYYVAKYGSFTKAAKILMNNQPNITRSIHQLESELGLTLFERSNKGAKLTYEGEQLFEYVSVAVEQIIAAEEAILSEKTLQYGSLSISVSETALHGLLLPIFSRFHQMYPHIKIRISNHSTPQAVNALKNSLVDFAVVTTPADIEKPLKSIVLKDFRELVVCSDSLSFLKNKTLSLKEISTYPIISLGRGTKTYEFYNCLFMQHGLTFIPDIEVSTADQIMPMVKNALGIGFVPEIFAVGPGFHKLQVKESIPKRSIILVKRLNHTLSLAAKEFEKMILVND